MSGMAYLLKRVIAKQIVPSYTKSDFASPQCCKLFF